MPVTSTLIFYTGRIEMSVLMQNIKYLFPRLLFLLVTSCKNVDNYLFIFIIVYLLPGWRHLLSLCGNDVLYKACCRIFAILKTGSCIDRIDSDYQRSGFCLKRRMNLWSNFTLQPLGINGLPSQISIIQAEIARLSTTYS